MFFLVFPDLNPEKSPAARTQNSEISSMSSEPSSPAYYSLGSMSTAELLFIDKSLNTFLNTQLS